MRKLNWHQKIICDLLWRLGAFQYKVELISDNPNPESIRRNIVYIVGGENYVKWVYMKCPDYCSEIIMLQITKEKYPSWEIQYDKIGRVTIYPSVNKLDGCKSHFWIKKGNIQWV
jgi:hypothetical protein